MTFLFMEIECVQTVFNVLKIHHVGLDFQVSNVANNFVACRSEKCYDKRCHDAQCLIQGGISQRYQIAYLLPILNIWTIKLFTNWEQIRLLNSKSGIQLSFESRKTNAGDPFQFWYQFTALYGADRITGPKKL